MDPKPGVKTGLQLLADEGLREVSGKRVGVVTNHTGVTADFTHIVDLFHRHPDLDVKVVFSPEHGFRGDAADGVHVENSIDSRTGIPVFSLYGPRLEPPRRLLEKLDLIIYDIQDVGARFYTYISTLFHVLKAAGEVGVSVLVLDRPNPITGLRVEGPTLEPRFRSFVGVWTIPVRYGLTVGELANLFNEEAGLGAQVEVLKMRGWRREMWFDETGLPWVPPSPNMPSLSTAIVYPGTCLLEGTNISEGRGTTRPFEVVGAPWLDEYSVIEELESLPLRGFRLRPSVFTPRFGKYRGEPCHGFQIYVTDRDRFEPVKFGLAIVWAIRRIHPKSLRFTRSRGRYYFDLLVGSDRPRKLITENQRFEELARVCEDTARFKKIRERYLLYSPLGDV